MSEIKTLTDLILKFRNERNWKQHHTPKNMAISLCLESAELLEHVQWKNGEELEQYLKENEEAVADELADVLFWVLLISHDLNIDIFKEFHRKMEKNKKKYPL